MGWWSDFRDDLIQSFTGVDKAKQKRQIAKATRDAKVAEVQVKREIADARKQQADQKALLDKREADTAASEEAQRRVRSNRKKGLLAYANPDGELLGG